MRRLIIRPGAIGDLIVSLPALEFVSTRETEIWVAEQNVPLVQFGALVRSIGSTGIDLVGLRDRRPPVLDRLNEFDSILSWYGTNRTEFREAVSHLPFTFFPALPMCAELHSCDFYLAQVGAPLGQIPRLTPAADRKGGLVVIHPFSGSSRKNWPLENFRAVARALPSRVEFTAGPEEQLPEARRFERLDHLAAYLATADLYIGNDSGVSHLAAAVGTPSIVLFRTTNPALWAPRSTAAVVVQQGDPEPSQVVAAANAILTSAGVTSTNQ